MTFWSSSTLGLVFPFPSNLLDVTNVGSFKYAMKSNVLLFYIEIKDF